MSRLALAIGLSLLYASAYFLAFLSPYALYFIPSFFGYVVYPSLISIFCLVPFFLLATSSIVGNRVRRALVFFGATILTIIAIKSTFDAAGYPWVNILTLVMPASSAVSDNFRIERIILVGLATAGSFIFVYLIRKRLSKWLRWLSTLGYAFVVLAIYRCVVSDFIFHAPVPASVAVAPQTAAPLERRVVWVIFDEMDYSLSLAPESGMAARMPNFSALLAHATSASQAYAPGRDTLYSIPALLTGTALSGVTIRPQNRLELINLQQKVIRFGSDSAVFSQLPGGPQSATVLGFYHPYCKLFPTLQDCHSTYLGNAGRWFDSLTFFSDAVFSAIRHIKWATPLVPEFLLFHFDPMYRVSKNVLLQLDGTLANVHSSLNFIHVNVPHLPNVYVQRLLKQPVSNDVEGYRQNLAGADMVLGRILEQLRLQAAKQNILLIVSSDHWLRTHSRQAAPVPFIAWKVGASAPSVLLMPFSTVHSKQLALDFLAGRVDTQAEVTQALRQTTYYATWSAPDGYPY